MDSTSNAPAAEPPGDVADHSAEVDDGEPDAPVAEAADPVNPDVPPGSPSGDEVYDAMLAENEAARSAEKG